MKSFQIYIALFFLCHLLTRETQYARVLDVGAGKQFASVAAAAQQAQPGDSIVVHAGTYAGGNSITNLQGSKDAWITICAAVGAQAVFRGGSVAIQFTDAAYLRITGLIFEGQTGNGMNIDDGGSYDTPTHSIVIERCEWRALNATGNNDQLKLSGVDTLRVVSCRFQNGSTGGSCIDMVGCHVVSIEECSFTRGGSNSVQAKGGSEYVAIERCSFIDGGERAINIGGSTGMEYFRPLNANFEAAHIAVRACTFVGSTAPLAFVGAVNCEAVNNTIYKPTKWVFRILQETTAPQFLKCSNNSFLNNIVYVGTAASNPSVNIGPNTTPESFLFQNNLWFNYQNASWSGPNLPAPETGRVLNKDPLFRDGDGGDFTLRGNSPAIGAGITAALPDRDASGKKYSSPRSIGAFEGAIANSVRLASDRSASPTVTLFPTITTDGSISLSVSDRPGEAVITIVDAVGRAVMRRTISVGESAATFQVPVIGAAGAYHLLYRNARGQTSVLPFICR